MPRELCPLKLSGIGSVVRQSNEVSSAAGGMSGCRSHQLHRHLVNSSAITVNKSCCYLHFFGIRVQEMQVSVLRPSGACGEGEVCVRILGQKLGLLEIQVTTLRCSQSTLSLCCTTPGASGKRLFVDHMLEIRLEMGVKKTP